MIWEATIAAAVYAHTGTIKGTAKVLGFSFYKTKKLLVTAGAIRTEEADLLREGFSVAEIAQVQRVSPSIVCRDTPYIKGVYNAKEPTVNALRIRACRAKKAQIRCTR